MKAHNATIKSYSTKHWTKEMGALWLLVPGLRPPMLSLTGAHRNLSPLVAHIVNYLSASATSGDD